MDTLQAIWDLLHGRARGLADALPKLLVALVIFGLLLLVGRLMASGIRAGTRHVERRRNVGVVLARLAQWAWGLFGLLVAVTIVFPFFTPGNLVQVLGIGSVAIGFAFRDILQNFLIVIPNARLFTEPVLVNTAFAERRVECDLGIGMGDDVERARQLMLETLRGLEGVIQEPPPEVLVVSLGETPP